MAWGLVEEEVIREINGTSKERLESGGINSNQFKVSSAICLAWQGITMLCHCSSSYTM